MTTEKTRPRDRLVETAARLFYRRGLPNVGINEVTDTAGVARMTLYNNFASKEALAEAAFKLLVENRRALLLAHLKRRRTPLEKICALFEAAETIAEQHGFRGCAFINLALEVADPSSILHALARDHKIWIRHLIADLGKKAGAAEPDVLAQQIIALWDGAIVEAYLQKSIDPIRYAKRGAALLIKTALP